jgi:transcriptional regulator with XRE-family HTH domain
LCRPVSQPAKVVGSTPPEAYPKEIKTLGDHLRKIRLDLGYLQREVAAIIGVDESTIYHWEGQRNPPEIRFIARIIEFLGYSPLPTPTNLSEQLIFYRTRQGFSQEKFAKILGIPGTTTMAMRGMAPCSSDGGSVKGEIG